MDFAKNGMRMRTLVEVGGGLAYREKLNTCVSVFRPGLGMESRWGKRKKKKGDAAHCLGVPPVRAKQRAGRNKELRPLFVPPDMTRVRQNTEPKDAATERSSSCKT